MLIGQLFLSIICFFLLTSWIKFSFNKKFISNLLVYGYPFGIVCTVSFFVPILERFFVKSFVSEFDLGLYAVALKISLCLAVFAQAFQTTWGPFSLKNYAIKNAEEIFNLILFLFTIVLSLLIIGITIFSKNIISILASDKYLHSYLLIFPICFGYSLQFIGWILEIGIHISKRTSLIFYGYIAYLISSFFSLILLCKYFGIIGVAISVPIGFLIKTIIDYKIACFSWKKIWNVKRIIIIKSYTFLVCTILLVINFYKIESYFLIFIILSILAFTFICYRFLNLNERKLLNGFNFLKKL